MKRTCYCGELKKDDAGRIVVLNGWVGRKRDHGGIFFINLRDAYGTIQVTIGDNKLSGVCSELRNEYCIAVEGLVRLRPDDMINPAMETGEIEVEAAKIKILNRCEELPFQVAASASAAKMPAAGSGEETNAGEELRLKYRYIDLRSPAMQKRIRLRSEVTFAVREWMTANGFCEI